MGAVGDDLGGAVLFQGLGGVTEGAGGIDHVVYQYAGTAFDVTDDVHHFGLVGLGTTLVDDRKIHAQGLGHGARAHHAADVRGDDHQVLEALVFDIVHQHGRTVDVVYRDIEEALDLIRVQVDREDTVDPDDGQHVGHYLGADGHAGGARTAILAGIAEVGDDSGDTSGRGAAEGIGHHHQFHQVVVGRRAGRLNQEYVLAADVFVDFDADFAIGEFAN